MAFIFGCSHIHQNIGRQTDGEQNDGTKPSEQQLETQLVEMSNLEYAKTIMSAGPGNWQGTDLAWAIPLVVGKYRYNEQWEKDYYKRDRAVISETAWNSPAMQFLIDHSEFWYEPFPVEVLNMKINGNRTKITGTLRLTLNTGGGVFDHPAFVDFEVTKAPGGWKYSKLGKVVIRKKYDLSPSGMFLEAAKLINDQETKKICQNGSFSGLSDLDLNDFVLTIDEDKLISTDHMIPSEYVWYVMFYDEISELGLGMGKKLINAVSNNQPTGVLASGVEKSPVWKQLTEQSSQWIEPTFSIKNFKLINRNKIRATMRIYPQGLYTNDPKWYLLDFELEKEDGDWRYTSLNLT